MRAVPSRSRPSAHELAREKGDTEFLSSEPLVPESPQAGSGGLCLTGGTVPEPAAFCRAAAYGFDDDGDVAALQRRIDAAHAALTPQHCVTPLLLFSQSPSSLSAIADDN